MVMQNYLTNNHDPMIPKQPPVAGLDTEKPVQPLARNRCHPEYHAPESMIGAIRAVLRSAGFQGVQEFHPPPFSPCSAGVLSFD